MLRVQACAVSSRTSIIPPHSLSYQSIRSCRDAETTNRPHTVQQATVSCNEQIAQNEAKLYSLAVDAFLSCEVDVEFTEVLQQQITYMIGSARFILKKWAWNAQQVISRKIWLFNGSQRSGWAGNLYERFTFKVELCISLRCHPNQAQSGIVYCTDLRPARTAGPRPSSTNQTLPRRPRKDTSSQLWRWPVLLLKQASPSSLPAVAICIV